MLFYEAAIARVGDASAEFRAVTASGAVIWCRETIRVPEPRVPGTDSEREPESRTITGVLTDITLRKQLEEQLLTGQRHDALQGLSSRLAHDLNNPLMIITGYTEEILQNAIRSGPDARGRPANSRRDRAYLRDHRTSLWRSRRKPTRILRSRWNWEPCLPR